MIDNRYRLFPLLCVLAACSDSGAPADSDAVPHRVAEVDLVIGTDDGDDATVFRRITGLALDARGRIYVGDAGTYEIRVFAPDGRFLFRIGRQGGGPGEFEDLCCLAVDDRNRLWARDGGNARYNVFGLSDTRADFLFSVRMAHADANFRAPIRFDSAGRLIDIGHRAEGDRLDLAHFHVDSAGAVIDSVRIPAAPAESLGKADVWARNGQLAFTAEWPAGVDLFLDPMLHDSVTLAVQRDSLDVQRVVRLRFH